MIWKTQRYDSVCEYIDYPLSPPFINLIEYLDRYIIHKRIRNERNNANNSKFFESEVDILAELEKYCTNKYFREKRF